jgi:hypothetical protein
MCFCLHDSTRLVFFKFDCSAEGGSRSVSSHKGAMPQLANDTLLSIALFSLYLCIAWEIFDYFSENVKYGQPASPKESIRKRKSEKALDISS